jgi:hypothetical protein
MTDAAGVAPKLEAIAGAAIATLRRKLGNPCAAIDGAGWRVANICGRTLNRAASAGEFRIAATFSGVARAP